MNTLSTLAWVLVAVLLVLYVYSAAVATWHIRRTSFFTTSQKSWQIAIVWCIPIIGVAVVLHMLGPEVRKRRPGWVPLLEPLVLGVFFLSVTDSIDASLHDSAPSDSSSPPDGGSDGASD